MKPTMPSDPLRDELLALHCQLGDPAACDELILRWALPLHRHALRVSGNPATADDVVQDVWLVVMQGIACMRDPAQFRSWLFGIAHRQLMSRTSVGG